MKEEAYRLQADLDDSHWWFQARREIIADVVGRFIPPGRDVLDYGCGTGAIAARLRELGYRVVGADVGEAMLDACRKRGVPTIDLRTETIPTAGADCVIACDVLEHAEDDVALLGQLRAALRPGGLFLGTVPAYEFLWSGEDYVSGHHRRYTRASLRRSLEAGGYRVLWSSYFNTLLFPLASSVILAKRLFRPRAMYHSNVEAHPRWQNDLLRSVFVKERGLLRRLRLPFGLSLIFAATPREAAAVDHRSLEASHVPASSRPGSGQARGVGQGGTPLDAGGPPDGPN